MQNAKTVADYMMPSGHRNQIWIKPVTGTRLFHCGNMNNMWYWIDKAGAERSVKEWIASAEKWGGVLTSDAHESSHCTWCGKSLHRKVRKGCMLCATEAA